MNQAGCGHEVHPFAETATLGRAAMYPAWSPGATWWLLPGGPRWALVPIPGTLRHSVWDCSAPCRAGSRGSQPPGHPLASRRCLDGAVTMDSFRSGTGRLGRGEDGSSWVPTGMGAQEGCGSPRPAAEPIGSSRPSSP